MRFDPIKPIQWIFSAIYLFLIIVTIPLAFDVGGEDCGIAFTFTLTAFYLVMSTIRIISRNTKFSIIGSLLYYLQHLIIIPSLLILHLSLFSEGSSPIWMKVIYPWSFFVRHATPVFTILEGFCTLLLIQATGQMARWASRKSDIWMFIQIIASGFNLTTSLYFLYRIYTFPVAIELISATLIGAILTISTFLGLYGIISGKGTPVESSMLFSYTVYGLYFTFTDFQSSITSSLLFPFLTPTVNDVSSVINPYMSTPTSKSGGSLGIFASLLRLVGLNDNEGVISNTVSSLVMTSTARITNPIATSIPPAFLYTNTIPPFPPIIITGYSNLVTTLAKLTPKGFLTVFEFFKGAISTITPSVAVSLAYRLFVFFAATRIIPSLNSTPPPTPSNSLSPIGSPIRSSSYATLANKGNNNNSPIGNTTPTATFSTRKRSSKSKSKPIIFIIYSYAPCIIIAVYTHLLLQHSTIFGASISGVGRIPTDSNQITKATTWWLNLIGGNTKLAWQFWGWANIFTTLALYGLELVYGSSDSQELINNHHFKTD